LKTCAQKCDSKMYLKEMGGKNVEGCGLDLSGAGWGPAVGCRKRSNELLQFLSLRCLAFSLQID